MQCEDCGPQEFNEGHIVEGLDRCHTIMLLLEDLLRDHPAVLKAGVNKKVGKASELVMDVYQAIGALEE